MVKNIALLSVDRVYIRKNCIAQLLDLRYFSWSYTCICRWWETWTVWLWR